MTIDRTFMKQALRAALAAGKEVLRIYLQPDHEVQLKADQTPVTLADHKAHAVLHELLCPSGLPLLSEEGPDIPYVQRRRWTDFWMLDPLDGTREFIRKNGEFTVNVAYIHHGRPHLGVVYAPAANQIWYGEVGRGAWMAGTHPGIVAEELMEAARPLPLPATDRPYRVVASRSHMNDATRDFMARHLSDHRVNEIVSRGSSLKLCMIAEGSADIYPRFGPTMEWDTAAGHAIVLASGGDLLDTEHHTSLEYNKPNLLNPSFIAKKSERA